MSTWGGIGEGIAQGIKDRMDREDRLRIERQAQANADRAFQFQQEQAQRAQANADRQYEANRADAATAQANAERQLAQGDRRLDIYQQSADREYGLRQDELALKANAQDWDAALKDEQLRGFQMANDKLASEWRKQQEANNLIEKNGYRQTVLCANQLLNNGVGEKKKLNLGGQEVDALSLPMSEIEKIYGKDNPWLTNPEGGITGMWLVDGPNGQQIVTTHNNANPNILNVNQLYDMAKNAYNESVAKQYFGGIEDRRQLGMLREQEQIKTDEKMRLQKQAQEAMLERKQMDVFSRQRSYEYRLAASGEIDQVELDKRLDIIDAREQRMLERTGSAGAGKGNPTQTPVPVDRAALEAEKEKLQEIAIKKGGAAPAKIVAPGSETENGEVGSAEEAVSDKDVSTKPRKSSGSTRNDLTGTVGDAKDRDVDEYDRGSSVEAASVKKDDIASSGDSPSYRAKKIINSPGGSIMSDAFIKDYSSRTGLDEYEVRDEIENGNDDVASAFLSFIGVRDKVRPSEGLDTSGKTYIRAASDSDAARFDERRKGQYLIPKRTNYSTPEDERLGDAAKMALSTASFGAGGVLSQLASLGVTGTSAKRIVDGRGTTEDGIVIAAAMIGAGKTVKEALNATRKFGIEMTDAAMKRAAESARSSEISVGSSRSIPKVTKASEVANTGFSNSNTSLAYTRISKNKIKDIVKDGYVSGEWNTPKKIGKGVTTAFDNSVGKLEGKGAKGEFGNAIITVKKELVGSGKSAPRLSDLDGIWINKGGKKVNILPDVLKQYKESASFASRVGGGLSKVIEKRNAIKASNKIYEFQDRVISEVKKRMHVSGSLNNVAMSRIRSRIDRDLRDLEINAGSTEKFMNMLDNKHNLEWVVDGIVDINGKFVK